jgi:exosome complex RNA-binding protein Rrp42 (RNase PH superfamily)
VFSLKTDEELLEDAEIGEKARDLLDTVLGERLILDANAEVEDAKEALLTVSPTETEEIRRLQKNAEVNNLFILRIKMLMDRGEEAITEWRARKDES